MSFLNLRIIVGKKWFTTLNYHLIFTLPRKLLLFLIDPPKLTPLCNGVQWSSSDLCSLRCPSILLMAYEAIRAPMRAHAFHTPGNPTRSPLSPFSRSPFDSPSLVAPTDQLLANYTTAACGFSLVFGAWAHLYTLDLGPSYPCWTLGPICLYVSLLLCQPCWTFVI